MDDTQRDAKSGEAVHGKGKSADVTPARSLPPRLKAEDSVSPIHTAVLVSTLPAQGHSGSVDWALTTLANFYWWPREVVHSVCYIYVLHMEHAGVALLPSFKDVPFISPNMFAKFDGGKP